MTLPLFPGQTDEMLRVDTPSRIRVLFLVALSIPSLGSTSSGLVTSVLQAGLSTCHDHTVAKTVEHVSAADQRLCPHTVLRLVEIEPRFLLSSWVSLDRKVVLREEDRVIQGRIRQLNLVSFAQCLLHPPAIPVVNQGVVSGTDHVNVQLNYHRCRSTPW